MGIVVIWLYPRYRVWSEVSCPNPVGSEESQLFVIVLIGIYYYYFVEKVKAHLLMRKKKKSKRDLQILQIRQ